jgi:hypothetical protein
VKTVALVPLRLSPTRQPVWDFVRGWIDRNYRLPVFTADSDGPVFSPGAARNAAARVAGDWDVALFHDCDTIAHPDAVAQAVDMAATSQRMVVAGDAHMYCDRPSSARIMASGNPSFARPITFDEHGIYEKPCSGVFAVSRRLFDRVGGYLEVPGWGYEDLIFLQACGIWGDGNTWVPGHITLHMWHEPSPRTDDTATNKKIWQTLTGYRRRADRDGARRYLASLGHRVP